MDNFAKLLEKIKNAPKNCRLKDLCSLAEAVRFERREQQPGSHITYRHPVIKEMMNFQPDPKNKSMAKYYQVKQLLNIIEDYGLTDKER